MFKQFITKTIPHEKLSPAMLTDRAFSADQTSTKHLPIFDDYNPDLIENLTKEHKEILKTCFIIEHLASEQEWEKTQAAMQSLSHLLNRHVDKENHILFQLLEDALEDDSQEIEMVQYIRRDLNQLSSNLRNFIHQYCNMPHDAINGSQFCKEFALMLRYVERRIELEESALYPLYEILYKKT